jgi:hypothetical protein
MGFFLILKFGIWYSQELRVQMVKWLNSWICISKNHCGGHAPP